MTYKTPDAQARLTSSTNPTPRAPNESRAVGERRSTSWPPTEGRSNATLTPLIERKQTRPHADARPEE